MFFTSVRNTTLKAVHTSPPQSLRPPPTNTIHMTTPDSSSGMDSISMEDTSNNSITNNNQEASGTELWETFSNSFRQVQSVLDQNRALIQQVNENHQSKLPDNLTKNVALIREINGNISTVVNLYSKLSANFTNVCQNRRGGGGMKNKYQEEAA